MLSLGFETSILCLIWLCYNHRFMSLRDISGPQTGKIPHTLYFIVILYSFANVAHEIKEKRQISAIARRLLLSSVLHNVNLQSGP